MIEPDDKDWTWVLERPCPECGFDASTFAADQVADEARANAARWVRLLAVPDASTRFRADRWSVLEYACHVRDVFRVCDYRLDRMLTEDGPHYENWDQDVTAAHERYGEQDPATVAGEVVAAARDHCPAVRDGHRRFLGSDGVPERRRCVHDRLVRPLRDPRPHAPPMGRTRNLTTRQM